MGVPPPLGINIVLRYQKESVLAAGPVHVVIILRKCYFSKMEICMGKIGIDIDSRPYAEFLARAVVCQHHLGLFLVAACSHLAARLINIKQKWLRPPRRV